MIRLGLLILNEYGFKIVDILTISIYNVEAKLHGESKVIQRCFDDNNDDNKR